MRHLQSLRTLFGISVFWLALSMLFDGLNALVLPSQLLALGGEGAEATRLGLVSFVGLLAAMLVQPVAGALSDELRPRWGRRGLLALGVLLLLTSLLFYRMAQTLIAVFLGYLLVQVAASLAQAAQQGFLPDLISPEQRGVASGLKGFMDLAGAMLAFVVLGELLNRGGSSTALLVIGGVILLAFILTLLLVREPTEPIQPTLQHRALWEAFRLDLREHHAFVWLIVSRFCFLLGTYAVGRFLLLFVAERLRLDPTQAAEETGILLGLLTLVTALAHPLAGWSTDRLGRLPLMLAGAALSALGVLLLILAQSQGQILLFGSLMALGSAAFASANWAYTADLAPQAEAGRFFGLANIGTAGAAAAAGLFGLLVDGANTLLPGSGYTVLFLACALAFGVSALALRGVRSSPEIPLLSTLESH
ncbi:MAG: MFS transporter [Ardenticatenales bacterium]|nr:MFS transporter [Ardenticatenales bacterium]